MITKEICRKRLNCINMNRILFINQISQKCEKRCSASSLNGIYSIKWSCINFYLAVNMWIYYSAITWSEIFRWPDKRPVDTSIMCYDHVLNVTDEPGMTLVGFHFSVNKPLPGVDAGDYNVDIRSKTGGSTVVTCHVWLFLQQHARYEVKISGCTLITFSYVRQHNKVIAESKWFLIWLFARQHDMYR